MAAPQAQPSLGFSGQEHWNGLPFPSPVHGSEKWKWSRSVVSNSRDPMDCSLPGSSVHGIFLAKVLEWGAIAFSILLQGVLQILHVVVGIFWRLNWWTPFSPHCLPLVIRSHIYSFFHLFVICVFTQQTLMNPYQGRTNQTLFHGASGWWCEIPI